MDMNSTTFRTNSAGSLTRRICLGLTAGLLLGAATLAGAQEKFIVVASTTSTESGRISAAADCMTSVVHDATVAPLAAIGSVV